MIDEQWINKQIGATIARQESLVDPSELSKVIIERVMFAIRQYRNEDPEPYRAVIEKHIQRRMQQMKEG